jgi:hypothetical protein
MQKRRVSRNFDKDGVTQKTTRGKLHNAVQFLQNKYDPIQVDDTCGTRMEKAGPRTLPLVWRDFLDTPLLSSN